MKWESCTCATLHVRDKDAEDRAFQVGFVDGHWEFLGDGEELKTSRDR